MPSETLTININTTHWQGGNKYRFNFQQPLDLRNKKCELYMYQYSIYYSTFNISAKLNNNTFSIKWINGVLYNYTIPDGNYSFASLNQYIQYCMQTDKLILQQTNDTTKLLYYISCTTNATQYASEIDINYFPNSLPAGYQIPSGATWSVPSQNIYPQLILSQGLRTMFGFSTQTTFPVSQSVSNPAKNLSFLSDSYPVITPQFVYNILCNMVSSRANQVPNHFYSIPVNVEFGKALTNQTSSMKGVTVNSVVYNFVELTFVDQDYKYLDLRDPEISVNLLITIEDEEQTK